jgi:hypothetical protein
LTSEPDIGVEDLRGESDVPDRPAPGRTRTRGVVVAWYFPEWLRMWARARAALAAGAQTLDGRRASFVMISRGFRF